MIVRAGSTGRESLEGSASGPASGNDFVRTDPDGIGLIWSCSTKIGAPGNFETLVQFDQEAVRAARLLPRDLSAGRCQLCGQGKTSESASTDIKIAQSVEVLAANC